MKRLAGLIAVSTLTGCAGINYLIDNYGDMQPVSVETAHGAYLVYDKPSENRMAVQLPAGMAAVQGIGGGLLLSPASTATPKPIYQAAAEAYLAQTGRRCKVTDGYLIVEPTWEFRYDCGQKA
jgi:hypothetical protein